MGQARKPKTIPKTNWRYFVMLTLVFFVFSGVALRAAYLQILQSNKLSEESQKRSVRVFGIESRRGIISDRNGIELARSIPVQSLWLDPKEVLASPATLESVEWKKLASTLEMPLAELNLWVRDRKSKRFAWLKRQLHPQTAAVIHRLKLSGVHLQAEEKRYYPTAEISAHILGFTGIDSNGLEGVEKAFNQVLVGEGGKEKVLLDLQGNVVEYQGVIDSGKQGENIELSIDSRIQALAYKELKSAVLRYGARAGSAVVLDIETGEVLAMVNQPSYNPNRLDQRQAQLTRNRSVTDMFEPGSTVKPFTVLTALEQNIVKPNTLISTGPGKLKVGNNWVRDGSNLGTVSVSTILEKSSNVGVTKLAFALSDDAFLDTFYALGFGLDTGSGFPGESAGKFSVRPNWTQFEKATMAYGYGFQVTPLQLAHAYAVLGSGGIKRSVSFLKRSEAPSGERIFSEKATQNVIAMMEEVLGERGTASEAALASYRAAGKTGTARKAIKGGYGDEYLAFFAGVSPVDNPRISVVVLIDEPEGDVYYGGDVAAPVFANIAEQTLRLLNVKPDKLQAIASLKNKEAKHG